ncbi:hypothetical protein AAWM_10296 [Aspergillus awamori]|uniref:Cysteine-rich transmembrane CYSTM domain-containing protein n=1 Tax=Aspergillus awamori TaxID=105351 RepID=A0A401L769_ASPAW|nr:hypothetical protein AAWM_10296 [Aspergillus awamori]
MAIYTNFFKWIGIPGGEEPPATTTTWDAETVTVRQPPKPAPPSSSEPIVDQQPAVPEQMDPRLRGGGAGDFCCGVCTGVTCCALCL